MTNLPSPPTLETLERTLEQTIETLRELGPNASMSAKAFRDLAHAWRLTGLQCNRIAGQLEARAKELRYKAEDLLLEMPDEPEESDEG